MSQTTWASRTLLSEYDLYSTVSYTADGASKDFIVPFPYLYKEDVHIYVDDVEQTLYPIASTSTPPSPYDTYWISDGTIRFVTTPSSGSVIRIKRDTQRAEPEVDFANASILNEEDLNLAVTQLLYIVQESYDNFQILYYEIDTKVLSMIDTVEANTQLVTQLTAAAEAARDSAVAAKERIEAIEASVSASLTAEGDTQISRVVASGDEQIARIESATDFSLWNDNGACMAATLDVTSPIYTGDTITLPDGIQYIVGRNHLLVSYDGVSMSPDWYTEVGYIDSISSQIKTKIPFEAGQKIFFWVAALGDTISAQTIVNMVSQVTVEGDTQVDRIKAITNASALEEGWGCASGLFTATEDMEAGTTITLPDGVQYLVGSNHILVSYEGVALSPRYFTEVGETGDVSSRLTLNVPLKKGQQVYFWVSPLGDTYPAEKVAETVATIVAEGDTQISRVESTGSSQVSAVTAEGDTQAARLATLLDNNAVIEGTGGGAGVLTLTTDVASGGTLTLPDGLKYVVGRNHLLVSYEGIVMSPDYFSEVGTDETESTSIITKVPLKKGMRVYFWVSPLGRYIDSCLVTSLSNVPTNLRDGGLIVLKTA